MLDFAGQKGRKGAWEHLGTLLQIAVFSSFFSFSFRSCFVLRQRGGGALGFTTGRRIMSARAESSVPGGVWSIMQIHGVSRRERPAGSNAHSALLRFADMVPV